MAPSKTRVFDKLFGGPLHGRRVAVDEKSYAMHHLMPAKSPTFTFNMPKGHLPPPTMQLHAVDYTQRRMQSMNTRVIFYAHSSLDDTRATEIVLNHMLRDARIVK